MPNHKFEKVFEPRRNRQVRGLWRRNGAFYAQLCLLPGNPRATLVRLHDAATIPQAIAAMQALKRQRHREGQVELTRTRAVPRFCELADAYLATVEAMGQKHRTTRRRERSSIAALKEFFRKHGNRPVTQILFGDALDYARWRRQVPRREGWKIVSGRAVDLDIIALRHVMDYARDTGHLKTNPIGRWKALAHKPKEVRLLPTEEVNRLIQTASQQLIGGRQFADYLSILAFTGGREQETLRLRWSVNVDWANRRLGFGQDGLSKYGKSRWVNFNPPLETKLKEMFERRAPDCDFLFPTPRLGAGKGPAENHPVTSYKKALISLKQKCGTVGRLGFHHFRHYFISVCAMSGVTLKSIQEWVGHEDLDLIAKIYAHTSDSHKAEQASKFDPRAAATT